MSEQIKENETEREKKPLQKLIERAADVYFSEIEPKKEKGEIDILEADGILDNLAKAEEMTDNAPEKLNIIEAEINRMKRILERETRSSQSAGFSDIAGKKQENEVLVPIAIESEKAEKEEKVEEIEDRMTRETKEEKKNLLNFRINISRALEDLSDELKMEEEKIDELYIKSDAVIGKDYHKIIDEIIDLQKDKNALDAKIQFYKELTSTTEPETEIDGAFIKGIIDEAEKDALLDFLEEESREKKDADKKIDEEQTSAEGGGDKTRKEEEDVTAVSSVHKEEPKPEKEIDKEEKEDAETLDKKYLSPNDVLNVFYSAVAEWFAEKEDLYDRGKISEKKFNQIESLREKLTTPVSSKVARIYKREIEDAYDTGIITEKEYEKLYPLAYEVDKDGIFFRSDEEKEKDAEDWMRYQKYQEAKEEEDFLENLDKKEIEAPVDDEELKRQRELRKKAKKLGIRRKKRFFSEVEEEELEKIEKEEKDIPEEIKDILNDAEGDYFLAKWFLKKLKAAEYGEKAVNYLEKIKRLLANKNKKIRKYGEEVEKHKAVVEEKKSVLANKEDDFVRRAPLVERIKMGAKLKDLFELKKKLDKIVVSLQEEIDDAYDTGKINTREYRERSRAVKSVEKAKSKEEARIAVETAIEDKKKRSKILSVLNSNGNFKKK